MKEGAGDLMSFWLWLTLSVHVCVHRWVLHAGVCACEHVPSWWFGNWLDKPGPETWVERIKMKREKAEGEKKQGIPKECIVYFPRLCLTVIQSDLLFCNVALFVLATCSCVPAVSFSFGFAGFVGDLWAVSPLQLRQKRAQFHWTVYWPLVYTASK